MADRVTGGLPISPGDVIASGPWDLRIPLDIWPMVSIQRPHTESWPIIMHELGYLEQWIRTTATPILITGTRDVPELPPQLDITTGTRTYAPSFRESEPSPRPRNRTRFGAAVARGGLLEILTAARGLPPDTIAQWIDTLADDEVVAHATRLGTTSGNLKPCGMQSQDYSPRFRKPDRTGSRQNLRFARSTKRMTLGRMTRDGDTRADNLRPPQSR